MKELTRRSFLNQALVGTGALLSAPVWAEDAPSAKRSVGDRVELGKTGIKVSRLAQGTGMHGSQRSSDHTKLGQEKFTELIRCGYEQGVNFYDMADLYGSHPFIKNALSGIPREDYVLLSKIWFRKSDPIFPSGGALEEVDRFRKELNTDMLDVCLIHCVTDSNWTEDLKRVRDELSELKQKQIVRAVGVSCHDHGALKVAAEHPWVDVIFARINHMGGEKYKMDGSVEEISATLRQARANGKAVVGMKIFGEGTLTQPDQKDASLKYVLGNNLVDSMTIGMLSTDEVNDSITRINKTLNV